MNAVSDVTAGSSGPRVPRTIMDLLYALSRPDMFHCMQGPPRAYMEIWPSGPHDERWPVRGVYQTIRFAMHASRPDAEPALVSAVLDVFKQARTAYSERFHADEQAMLFWRRLPCIESYAPGELCIGVDANGTEVYNDQVITTIYARAWVPGVMLPDEGEPQTLEG